MKGFLRTRFLPLAAAVALAGMVMVPTARADDGATVLATVDGRPVTLEEVRIAIASLPAEYQEMARGSMASMMVQQVVDLKLLAGLATGAGIADDADYQTELAFLTEQLMREHYLRKLYSEKVTDESVRARYEDLVERLAGEPEIRARHILVETREEAEAVAAKIAGGADFAEQAKESSIGPTGPNGGDLGFFGREAMVAEFAEAAFALDAGEVSGPVETQFGWHIIKVEETRSREAPAFELVEADIREELSRMAMSEALTGARETAEVEIFEADLPALLGAEEAQ